MRKKTQAKKLLRKWNDLAQSHQLYARGLYWIVSTPLSQFIQLKRGIFLRPTSLFHRKRQVQPGIVLTLHWYNSVKSTNGVRKICWKLLWPVKVILEIIKRRSTLFCLSCDGVPLKVSKKLPALQFIIKDRSNEHIISTSPPNDRTIPITGSSARRYSPNFAILSELLIHKAGSLYFCTMYFCVQKRGTIEYHL